MKKIILVLLIIILLISLKKNNIDAKEERRGIFISYIELEKYIKGTPDNIKKNIDLIIKNIDKENFNTVYLQVRPFSDSIYESKYFPWSSKISSSEGISPNIDILKYFIDTCHSKNISLHAWINPYRIRLNKDTSSISKNNPAYKWLNTNNVEISDKGIYYNPASSEVRTLILNGIKEIVNNYDVDGIIFDDYFYPTDTIDKDNYNEYIKTNDISLKDYRLLMVNTLVKNVKKITTKKKILFGISPEGNIENNYNKNYADVKKWAKSNKYVDYLMPQLYYGFNNETKPFYKTLHEWEKLVDNSNTKLIIALSLYKSGVEDSFAKGGVNEWIDNNDIVKRQIIVSRNINNYLGFSIYRYDYMFSSDYKNNNLEKEIKNIKKIMIR